MRSSSRPPGGLPSRRERYRRDRRDARGVGLSRGILEELRHDRRVACSGASVVALVGELDQIRAAERGGDTASLRRRRSVVEVAGQDQRGNVAPDGGRHRFIALVWKPLLACSVDDTSEWRSRERVDGVEGAPVGGAGGGVVGTEDDVAQRAVPRVQRRRTVRDLAGGPQAITGPQLVEQQRETAYAQAWPTEDEIADVVDETSVIEPDGVAPAIGAHDGERWRFLKQGIVCSV